MSLFPPALLSRLYPLLGAALLATACGPASQSDDGGGQGGGDGGPGGCSGPACMNECPDGTSTTLSGRVLAPNGIDPIPGAQVYVPRQVTDFPATVACEVCKDITDAALVSTTTNVDGTFTLGPIPTVANQAPGESVVLVSQKGRFRKVANVVIDSPCGGNSPSQADTTLPSRNEGQDRVPNIAVVTGDYDQMECVLLNMGLASDAISIYDGMPDPFLGGSGTPNAIAGFDTLLQDGAAMKQYNIIFINCSNDQYESLLDDAQVRANIDDYVASGGRLYVTDWSYDYIEQISSFAGMIDFAPGESGGEPEPKNDATVGDGDITTEALIHDEELAAWLNAVESVTGEEIISDDGRVHIEHFLVSWVMQLSVLMSEDVKLWLTGDVSGNGLSGEYPLTTTFDYNDCGRVLYSSYHTLGRDFAQLGSAFPNYCGSAGLSPQERVLMFLIMHVADCIDVVVD